MWFGTVSTLTVTEGRGCNKVWCVVWYSQYTYRRITQRHAYQSAYKSMLFDFSFKHEVTKENKDRWNVL